jgi:hypothetical protein
MGKALDYNDYASRNGMYAGDTVISAALAALAAVDHIVNESYTRICPNWRMAILWTKCILLLGCLIQEFHRLRKT